MNIAGFANIPLFGTPTIQTTVTSAFVPHTGAIMLINPARFPATAQFFLQVTIKTSVAPNATQARLMYLNLGVWTQVAGSGLSSSSLTLERVRSVALTLPPGDNEYRVEYGGNAGAIHSCSRSDVIAVVRGGQMSPTEMFDPEKYIRLVSKGSQDVADDMHGELIDNLFFFNPDTKEPEITTLGQRHPLLSKGQWDVVVDDAYLLPFSDTVPTILEAIAATEFRPAGVSVFIRSAGDADPLTIASADALQRLQGKDADTTIVPVDLTCNKPAVTFEQLNITSLLDIKAVNQTLSGLLISSSGRLILNTACAASLLENVRVRDCSSTTPLSLFGSYLTVRDIRCDQNSGTNHVLINGSNIKIAYGYLARGFGLSGYLIAGQVVDGSIAYLDLVVGSAQGGIDLTCFNSEIGPNNTFGTVTALSTPALRLNAFGGTPINTTVVRNRFTGSAASDVLFECVAADADAEGLMLVNNTANVGTIKGSQDAVWIGNNFAGATIDFQSKTGIIVLGGDMTGCTILNEPADLVMRDVAGQDDRGDLVVGGDLLPADDNVYDIGASAPPRWRNIYIAKDIKTNQDIHNDTTQVVLVDLGAGTRTIDYAANQAFGVWFHPTLRYKQAGNGLLQVESFVSHPIIINDAAVSVNPGPYVGFGDGPTIRVDTAVGRVLSVLRSLNAAPSIDRVNAGTMTVTELTGVYAWGIVGAGITVTTRRGLWVPNIAPAGTITTQIGVDIDALTGAGTNIGIRNASPYVSTPSTVQTIAAGTAILANAELVQIQSTGAVTVTAAPTIAGGQDGQQVTIMNVDTTDAITLQDQGTLASSNLRLATTTIVLGPRDSIRLAYSATIGDWVEIGRTNVL